MLDALIRWLRKIWWDIQGGGGTQRDFPEGSNPGTPSDYGSDDMGDGGY